MTAAYGPNTEMDLKNNNNNSKADWDVLKKQNTTENY